MKSGGLPGSAGALAGRGGTALAGEVSRVAVAATRPVLVHGLAAEQEHGVTHRTGSDTAVRGDLPDGPHLDHSPTSSSRSCSGARSARSTDLMASLIRSVASSGAG